MTFKDFHWKLVTKPCDACCANTPQHCIQSREHICIGNHEDGEKNAFLLMTHTVMTDHLEHFLAGRKQVSLTQFNTSYAPPSSTNL